MSSITLDRTDVIIGVDTHKHRHVAVAVDGLGGRLDDLDIEVTTAGYEQLLAWAQTQGRIVAFGIEGTGWLRHGTDSVSAPPRPPCDRGRPS